ncbi:hypothetical protein HWV07_07055 [Natronomonas salina]|uniref:hypothetical protein n=1 Tax=Natronomonas salina TaxID=1710540 RepID=UPI0015B6625E|nr:hypothetical protein [Natronomonas salina]QLD88804.1 hypothetical protein HWV07_07055 [Natronomonas salina]
MGFRSQNVTDPETGENWVTGSGSADRLGWTFTYQGEPIEVYDATPYEDATAAVWRFLLPVADPEGVRPITVQFTDDRSAATCFEGLTAIAQAVIESLTPNPEWEQPTAS